MVWGFTRGFIRLSAETFCEKMLERLGARLSAENRELGENEKRL